MTAGLHIPYYDNLTAQENVLMQGYEFNFRWLSKAPDVDYVRKHHQDNLDKIVANMMKSKKNAKFMLSTLLSLGMMTPEKVDILLVNVDE